MEDLINQKTYLKKNTKWDTAERYFKERKKKKQSQNTEREREHILPKTAADLKAASPSTPSAPRISATKRANSSRRANTRPPRHTINS